MVVASKFVKLGQERAKRLGMRTCGDVGINSNCFSQRYRQYARLITHSHSAQSGPIHRSLCPRSTPEASRTGGTDWGRGSTCPVPTRFVPRKVANFINVAGVDLHFFGRYDRKRHIRNVKNPIALIREVSE